MMGLFDISSEETPKAQLKAALNNVNIWEGLQEGGEYLISGFVKTQIEKALELLDGNGWVKPSELPEKFHGECWVSWKCPFRDGRVFAPKLYTVQNYYRGTCAEYWCDDGYYRSLPDTEYRVMILHIPSTPIEEYWND